MGNSIQVANISGFKIYVNWTWVLIIAFFTFGLGGYYHHLFPAWTPTTDYVAGFVSGILLFVTVLLHELGHSFTARARDLPVNTITLYFFGGVSNLTREPQSPQTEFLVAVAGPAVSLILSGIFYLVHAGTVGIWPEEVTAVIGYLAFINLVLAVFNLLPAFPLDGGRVFRSVVWWVTGNKRRATQIADGVTHVFGWLFILAGLYEAVYAGSVISGVYLAVLGWFLMHAASATYKQTIMSHVLQGVDVKDVMSQPPTSVAANTPVHALVYQHMLTANQRVIPVGDMNDRLLGLVTLGDVRHTPQDQWASETASHVMTPAEKLVTVTPEESLNDAMHALAENNYHQLPVLENGRLVGMLDRSHVMQYLHMREQLADTRKLTGADRDSTLSPSEAHKRAG